MTMLLRFWLLAMDLIAFCGGFGSRPYLWAVGHAADCIGWDAGNDEATR